MVDGGPTLVNTARKIVDSLLQLKLDDQVEAGLGSIKDELVKSIP